MVCLVASILPNTEDFAFLTGQEWGEDKGLARGYLFGSTRLGLQAPGECRAAREAKARTLTCVGKASSEFRNVRIRTHPMGE